MEITVNGNIIKLSDQEREILKATASADITQAATHRQALAQVMEQAWKSGVLEPDLLGTIFQKIQLPAGVEAKFPFDFYAPSNEGAYKAFVIPREGAIPDRVLDADEIRVPTYKIGNAISWSLDYARDARWDIVAKAIEVFTNGFVRKINDDGWHVLLRCAKEAVPGIQTDTAATAGIFSKRLLLSLMVSIKQDRKSVV